MKLYEIKFTDARAFGAIEFPLNLIEGFVYCNKSTYMR